MSTRFADTFSVDGLMRRGDALAARLAELNRCDGFALLTEPQIGGIRAGVAAPGAATNSTSWFDRLDLIVGRL